MTVADAALDFFIDEQPEQASSPAESKSAKREPLTETAEAAEDRRKATEEIAAFFAPAEGEQAETKEQETGEAKPKAAKKEAAAKPAESKIDDSLVEEAIAVGIHPAEARMYPSNRSLLAVIRERERRADYDRRVDEAGAKADKKEAEADLPDFKLEIDEDADPSVRKMAESMNAYAANLKAAAGAQIKAVKAEVEELRGESSKAAEQISRDTQRQIVEAYDEEVKSWGDEFSELLGVPSESIQTPGTEQHTELQKLNEFVELLQRGYANKYGKPTPAEAVRLTRQYVRQGRDAIWPEMAEKRARSAVSEKLRRQKGGVGLRPSRARSLEPPAQGDDAAKEAIGAFMADHGIDPWQRRSA